MYLGFDVFFSHALDSKLRNGKDKTRVIVGNGRLLSTMNALTASAWNVNASNSASRSQILQN